MTRDLVAPDTPCVIHDFDPSRDILVVALPEDSGGGLDHALSFRFDARRNTLVTRLTHHRSGAQFIILLPGVRRLDASSIAVLSLSDAERLDLPGMGADTATLTGNGLYPAPPARSRRKSRAPSRGQTGSGTPRKMAYVHGHNWHASGPPPERFFDLSDPASELVVTLKPDTGGPIYAIRLTETAPENGENGAGESHGSIILAQSAPGTPHLSPGILAQWFATRLGSDDFRAIAWIWLGAAGHYTDPATGRRVEYGAINERPQLAIRGKLAGSIAVTR